MWSNHRHRCLRLRRKRAGTPEAFQPLDSPLVRAVPAEEAAGHFTWLSGFIGLDSPASSERTRALLGWNPTGPGLIEDLDKGHYFRTPGE